MSMCGLGLCLCPAAVASSWFKFYLDEKLEAESHLNFKNRGPDYYSVKTVELTQQNLSLLLQSSVLNLRGNLTYQPTSDERGGFLLWNGEVFDGLEILNENDTSIISRNLAACTDIQEILNVLASIRGPWAFIYYSKILNTIYFGRDVLGRRSLLWHIPKSETDAFVLTSVTEKPVVFNETCVWQEVPANGVYYINFTNVTWDPVQTIFKYPLNLVKWQKPGKVSLKSCLSSPLGTPFNTQVDFCFTPKPISDFHDCQIAIVNNSQMEPFENLVESFLRYLSQSVKRRVFPLPAKFSRVAILFSGGVDSMMIAAHATAHIPSNEPIDLINVAFTLDSENINNSNVPDRVTGRKGVQELAALYPERTWNFIEVDVTLTELYLHKEHIKTLCTPLSSVMDLSIASALWFASRGIGKLRRYTSDILSTSENYETPARILLVGIGADEQLGGYRKHRMVFHKGGWEALAEELQRGIQAISYRNLGRDDRVIGDHGREARFPFLDEDLVNFLSSVPVWLKADLRYPRGLGEKYLLRKAAWKVGMKNSAFMEKRAIQFGSRVAHLEKFMGKKLKNLL